MGFKQRWSLVGLIVTTAAFVFWIPLDSLSTCSCPQDNNEHGCIEELQKPHTARPREVFVHNEKELNQTIKNIFHQNVRNQARRGLSRPEFHKDGWVLDCVSWEKKWEFPPLETDPHDFMVEVFPLGVGENASHRLQTFQEIFQKKDWPANDPAYDGLQRSGPGAMLRNAQGVIAILHVIITKLKAYLGKKRIALLDIPCGDLQWMSKFLQTRTDVDYVGVDIVPEIIEHHQKKFDRLPNVKFKVFDIVKAPMQEQFDLVIMRDMLQHLWKADAMRVLDNISKNGGYLLTTTYPDSSQNGEVERDALGGRKFPYNLELPPFLLEPPVCMSYDWNVEHLGLWSLPLKQKYDYS